MRVLKVESGKAPYVLEIDEETLKKLEAEGITLEELLEMGEVEEM